MFIDEDDYLAHYGILRKSGRYPWGSGSTQAERNRTFLGMAEDLRKKGLSEVEVARGLGLDSVTQLRNAKTIARNAEKQSRISQAQRLHEKGMSNVAIGKRMGIPESSVRALLAPGQADKTNVLISTSKVLRDQVAEKKYLDIGTGTEHQVPLGISRTKFNAAVALLMEEGYTRHYVKVPQLGTGNFTTQTVLAAPGTKYSEVYRNRADVQSITGFSDNGGRTILGLKPPVSLSSKRIAVRYAEDGGADADGIIYVRRGKEDLSLGGASYAQVRIAVDGSHYLKGMAMYKDDLPPGVDVMFNTNKRSTGNKLDAMKPLKRVKDTGEVDQDNPFGATIKRQRGVMNIINEEGDWDSWSASLSSQMLSKQTPRLAREQLGVTQDNKRRELESIMALTNPAVRKKLLMSFADDADSAAVHLKAAGLKGTSNHVLLPFNSVKETEIYAPNFRDGDRVVLVRHPHGGIFEIPELTVNNKNPQAKRAIGQARDAVGINHKVAARLSGADFDGDHVLVIPNNNKKIKTAPALEGLKDFDPQRAFPGYPGMPKMSARTKAVQMGEVSNLIADMTIRGANSQELARAVRHSMVVIDAEKHDLNWRESAVVNGISQLKAKYQNKARGGASTLITKAGSEVRVPARKGRPAAQGGPIDKLTGKKVFVPTGEMRTNRQGKTVPVEIKSKKLAETDDAHTLSSGTPIEKVYADHSNKLKGLANQARLSAVNTKGTPYSSSAKTAYSKEVASLNAKLVTAQRNAPLERQAQVLAGAVVAQKLRANPDMEASEIKRLKAQALAAARVRTGAHKQRIALTPAEWAAIQAGAISNDKLNKILDNADLDQVKALATPRTPSVVTGSKRARAKALLDAGYTQAQVADAIGVSLTTLKTSLME